MINGGSLANNSTRWRTNGGEVFSAQARRRIFEARTKSVAGLKLHTLYSLVYSAGQNEHNGRIYRKVNVKSGREGADGETRRGLLTNENSHPQSHTKRRSKN